MPEHRGSPSVESPRGADGGGSPIANRIKERGADLGRKVVNAIDSGREGVANQLDNAAYRAEQVSSVADRTADKLESMAQYVRDHETRALIAQVERLVRSHPGKSLVAVAAIGYLTGRALRRN